MSTPSEHKSKWRWPLVIGLFSAHCFAAAILTEDMNDKIAWFSLAAPSFLVTFGWNSRLIRSISNSLYYPGRKTFKNPW